MDELERLDGGDVPPGGPDHYVATVLRWADARPVLLISGHRRTRQTQRGRAAAQTLGKRAASRSPLGALVDNPVIFARSLRALLQFRPTHILCAATGPLLWASYCGARLCHAQLVHTRHASLTSKAGPVARLAALLDRVVLKRLPAVICHGPYLHEQLVTAGVSPERTIEFNLSYRYLLGAAGAANRELPAQPNFLYVGRIDSRKGVFDLLHAFAEISCPDAKLVFVGEGPDLGALHEAIATLRLQRRVVATGHLPHDQVAAHILSATALVAPTQPSLTESRCKSAIEALVLGCPVIAPRFGPFPYIIEHQSNGLLYRPGSRSDLAHWIRALATDAELARQLSNGALASRDAFLHSRRDFAAALHEGFELAARLQNAQAEAPGESPPKHTAR